MDKNFDKCVFVPLGSACGITYRLQELQLRNCAFPFDWIRTNNFNSIIDCINDDFKGFTDFTKLGTSESFPYLGSNDDFVKNSEKELISIMTNKYSMRFYHDFKYPVSPTQMIEVKDKYEKRISRFIETMKSNKFVWFIRDELVPNKVNNKMLNEFIAIIKKKYNSKLQCAFIVSAHNPNKKDIVLKQDDDVKHVIDDGNEFGDWTRPNLQLDVITKLSKV